MVRMYDFKSEEVRKFLRDENPQKVCIQLPSGLRPYANEIKDVYDDEGIEFLFLSDSCFGACDISDDEAIELDCEAIVHYGHADMNVPTSLPIFYVEVETRADPSPTLEKALPVLEGSVWGLTATIQHVHQLEKVRELLDGKGIKSKIGGSGPRSKYPGQILGCDWRSALSVNDEVDGFIYLGTGRFHPRGVSLATGKRVVALNPVAETFELVEPDWEEFLRKRRAMLAKAESSDSIGVLVSTKTGQNRQDLAEELARKLSQQGYDSFVLVGDEVSPSALMDFQFDALISTACPRIALDDADLYDVPLITPFEAKVLLGEEDWTPYRLDEIGINF